MTRLFSLTTAATAALILPAFTATAADHKEAPLIQQEPAADIADVYAFVDPNDDENVILIMTVNPLTVPSENNNFHFSSDVRHVFTVLNNEGQMRILVEFAERTPSSQRFSVKVPGVPRFSGDVTQPSIEPKANDPIIVDGFFAIRAFAGQTDDPFFFDVVGFNRFLAGTGGFEGNDGFAGENVSAIVLSIPRGIIDGDGTSDNIEVWGSTERRRTTIRRSSSGELERNVGPWEQIERMGNPVVNTALIPFKLKDFYNIGRPENDGNDFAGEIVASLMALGTNNENIAILASVAVPDTLKLNLGMDSQYPNGRALSDDVIDTLLFFIFNQNEVPDGVDGNDKPFRSSFPYLASPHQPE
ncbi:MAG: DUF4331 family protein [Phycisphaerales bacterium]